MTEQQRPKPEWWSAPEALAWQTFGQGHSVYLVRREMQIRRESGRRESVECPDLLDIPTGQPTPWTPDGMLPANSAAWLKGCGR